MNGWRRWFARWPTAALRRFEEDRQAREARFQARREEIFLSLTQNGGEAV